MAPLERTWAHVCGSGQEGGSARLATFDETGSKTHTISHRGACRAPCMSRSALLCRYLGTCIPQRKIEGTLSIRKRVELAQFLGPNHHSMCLLASCRQERMSDDDRRAWGSEMHQ